MVKNTKKYVLSKKKIVSILLIVVVLLIAVYHLSKEDEDDYELAYTVNITVSWDELVEIKHSIGLHEDNPIETTRKIIDMSRMCGKIDFNPDVYSIISNDVVNRANLQSESNMDDFF